MRRADEEFEDRLEEAESGLRSYQIDEDTVRVNNPDPRGARPDHSPGLRTGL